LIPQHMYASCDVLHCGIISRNFGVSSMTMAR